MSWFTDLYRSAVGKKAVMAVTGIILFGFIVLHLIGNLKLYEPGLYKAPGETGPGVHYINAYGVFLRHVGEPALPAYGALWIVRVILLVAVILHIWAAWQLTLMSRAARINSAAIFTGLLFWSWVWGVWGTILAVPMLMMIKAVCDHIEDLQPIGELLGE